MNKYEDLCVLLKEISSKQPFIMAIDGRCAAGKTTLAEHLKKEYECNVIHIDDFYLPMQKRTEDVESVFKVCRHHRDGKWYFTAADMLQAGIYPGGIFSRWIDQ